MTAQSDPYVRVYYSITDDPKFAGIGDRALGCWLRLLIVADGMYPTPAYLPRKINGSDLKKLAEVGLIDLLPDDRFRVRGLAAEREQRTEAARFAADVKHHGLAVAVHKQSERSAPAVRPHNARSAEAVPLRTAPLHSEPNHSAPTHARENGSKDPESDEERLTRYLSLRDDVSRSADVRAAAFEEVKRLQAGLKPELVKQRT